MSRHPCLINKAYTDPSRESTICSKKIIREKFGVLSESMGQLLIDRVYDVLHADSSDAPDSPATTPAYFLVDRLWPRGVKKADLPLDGWPKELTPSKELRTALHEDDLTWENFTEAYRGELDERHADHELDDALAAIRTALSGNDSGTGDVVLLFAGKDTDHTHAKVLRDWLENALTSD